MHTRGHVISASSKYDAVGVIQRGVRSTVYKRKKKTEKKEKEREREKKKIDDEARSRSTQFPSDERRVG
jgi:hypothetical protein